MTKDVLVAIKGLQFDPEDEDRDLETVNSAEYYKRGSSHYVLYEEVMEGFEGSIKNVIKLKGNTLDLTKKGLVNVHMIFEENKKNMTSYSTPFGDILVGIDTHRIGINEEEGKINVEVDYSLEMNYEHLAECRITVDIRSKEEGIILNEKAGS